MAHFLIIAFICGVVIALGKRHYVRAMQVAAFFGVSCTNFLVIDVPGNLPNITVQRALVITLFSVWWICRRRQQPNPIPVPLVRQFKWVAATYGVSLMLGLNWQDGFKDYLSFLFESWVFYYVIYRGVNDREEAQAVLRAASLGLVVVSFFAFTERYAGLNPVDRWLPGYVRSEKTYMDILSTYPHRILLGTAAAMGVPLVASQGLFFSGRSTSFNLWVRVLGMTICASACYFANSRGPWIAVLFGMASLWLLGTAQLRRLANAVAALAVVGMVLYPGVRETLVGRFESTSDATTFKGGTYQYRWELWRVAFTHIRTSPVSLAFGLGPSSSRVIDQTWDVSYGESTRPEQIWSWDNEYAYFLLSYGVVGLGLTLVLYGLSCKQLLAKWRAGDPQHRDGLAGVIGALAVLFFMKSNVLVFAPQLNLLLWLLVACGLRWQDTHTECTGDAMPQGEE